MTTDQNKIITDNKASITIPIEMVILSLSKCVFQVSVFSINIFKTRLSDQQHRNIVALFSYLKPVILVECIDKSFGRLLKEENISRMFF
jgi:hypothetical protein